MKETLCYQVQAINIPKVNLIDTALIKPPYIHFRRKANEYILYYVLSGEMHLMEGKESYNLKKNDWIILDPSREHYGVKSTTCNFIYVHFNIDNLKEIKTSTDNLKDRILQKRIETLNSESSILTLKSSKKESHHLDDGKKELIKGTDPDTNTLLIPKYSHISDTSIAIEIISKLDRLQGIHKTMLEYRQIQTGCLLMELLILLSREFISDFIYAKNASTSKSLRTVYDIASFLDSSYSIEITSSLLEEKFNCNFDYINRVFKKILGKTIFAYLNSLRIEKAKQLLSIRIYSLSDVAEKTGFHDVYYFSKVFKKYAGITPGAYIKQLS